MAVKHTQVQSLKYLLCKDGVHNLLAGFLSKSSCSENVRKLQVKLS